MGKWVGMCCWGQSDTKFGTFLQNPTLLGTFESANPDLLGGGGCVFGSGGGGVGNDRGCLTLGMFGKVGCEKARKCVSN